MAQKQQELAEVILQDPAVESLSSFIGADGINTTLNSGRYLDQPEAARTQRHHERLRCDPPAANKPAAGAGNHLYMQPVQNITVDDRVSRTQYQYTLEDPDSNELNQWTNKFVAQLKKLPELEDVATDQQTGARAVYLTIDRVTASRLGIAPYHRQHPLRRLRPAPDQHAVHPAQPVSRDLGDGAAMAADSDQTSAISTFSRALRRAPQAPAPCHSFSASASASAGSNATHDLGTVHAVYRSAHTTGNGSFGNRSSSTSNTASTPRRPKQFRSAPLPTCANHRGADDQPPGTVPCRHGIVQPGDRMRHWARDHRDRQSGQEDPLPDEPAVGLPGNGGRLQELALQRSPADSGRAGHGLHRAGRAL